MPEIQETTPLADPPDTVWRRVGGFASIGQWHPMLDSVEVDGDATQPGARRTAHAADGSTQVERLTVYDADGHRYRYVMEETGLPVSDYDATFAVEDDGSGGSIVRWSASFDVTSGSEDDAVEMVGGFVRAGLDALE